MFCDEEMMSSVLDFTSKNELKTDSKTEKVVSQTLILSQERIWGSGKMGGSRFELEKLV